MTGAHGRRGAGRTEPLDIPSSELDVLLTGAAEIARHEIELTQSGPVFDTEPSAEAVSNLLATEHELPIEGESVASLLERCRAVLTAGRRTAPTFFGYVLSPPVPAGVAADLIVSAADQNVTSWRSAPVATELERTVLKWLGRFVGFAEDADGILLSGGSAANLTALLCALRAGDNRDADRRSLVVYASGEAHFSVAKAAEVLGVAVNTIAMDKHGRLDATRLDGAISADHTIGRRPFCVVATAGTTATGTVDPLGETARVAHEHGLWCHIDGAYGAPAAAVPAQRYLFEGIELADSLCIDAHKWLYAPLDCGALLLKPGRSAAFAPPSDRADYVRVLAEQPAEEFAFWDHGLELSRRFRALKLWMIFRYYGARRLASAIAEDIEMASYLAERIRQTDGLELVGNPGLSICCFRHRPPQLAGDRLDDHNERLLRALQRAGSVYLSNANVNRQFALRACITNFRTTRGDLDRTVDAVQTIGEQLLGGPDDPEPPRI